MFNRSIKGFLLLETYAKTERCGTRRTSGYLKGGDDALDWVQLKITIRPDPMLMRPIR